MRHLRASMTAALTVFCVAALALAGLASAGETSKLTVKLTDPDKPCFVECGLLNGGITVEGYGGKEVIIEARQREDSAEGECSDWDHDHDDEGEKKSKEGLKRIAVSSSAFEVEEDDNRIEVSVDSWSNSTDVFIKVPRRTSLNVQCINDGDIEVSNVTGEIEAKNINGNITLAGISGSVVAYVQNGDMTAELKSVTKNKPMSFASFNGDVDVTLPAGVKATVKVSTHTGDAYSDFDIKVLDRPAEVIEDNDEHTDGKYRVRIEDAFYGNINGGGPEFDLSTFNGDIYIRKAK